MASDSESIYERWEYHTEFVEADAKTQAEFMQRMFPAQVAKYAVQAALPRLNELGDAGWELVHMEPVSLGSNEDVRFVGGDTNIYSRKYFCVFKRRKRL